MTRAGDPFQQMRARKRRRVLIEHQVLKTRKKREEKGKAGKMSVAAHDARIQFRIKSISR